MFIEADGRPNGGQRTLVIRGFNTLGNTNPLFVIDGVPTLNQTAFQSLDPNLYRIYPSIERCDCGFNLWIKSIERRCHCYNKARQRQSAN